jgi:hypothetical protein
MQRHSFLVTTTTSGSRHRGLLKELRLAFAYGIGWLVWLLMLPPRPPEWLIVLTGLPLLGLASHAGYRGEPGRWRAFVARTWDLHALGGILLVALAVQFADTHGVTTDGVIYLTQLRSVIFDGDLEVASEFAFLQQPPRPSHVVPLGPTVVWLPLYLAVASVHWLARAIGFADPQNGASIGLTLPYIRAALVSSFAIGAVGLFVVHARLRKEFTPGVAFAASALLFAATPLVWYMVYEPSMTHAASFGFVAVFVVAAAVLTNVRMSVAASLLLGALLGLAVITRPQEAVFALFPAMILVFARERVRARVEASARLAAWAFVGIAPFLAMQAIHTAILINREPFALVGGGGYLDFANSRWADTLWSSWHGFFSWTPVTYIAFLAMVAYARRDRAWATATVLTMLIMAWVNGSTADWSGGWSFGGRRFISVLPLLAPGIAMAIWGLVRRPLVALALTALVAVAWNGLLVTQHERDLLNPEKPVSFAQIIRRQAELATASPFFYPFSFPANVVFAMRTGMPIEYYDLLGSEAPRAAIDLEMTPSADRFLTQGWGARTTDPFGELRWIDGATAEIVLPLDLPSDRSIRVAWSARTRQLDPPDLVTFALVINGRETFRFTPETEQSSHFAFTVPAGEAVWVRGFNRVAFERRLGAAPMAIYRIAVTTEN